MPLRCMQNQAYMPDTPLLCLVLQIANHISCMIVIANGTILSQPQLLLIYASGPPSSLSPLPCVVTASRDCMLAMHNASLRNLPAAHGYV